MSNAVYVLFTFAAHVLIVASAYDFAWCRKDKTCPLTQDNNPTSGACTRQDKGIINKMPGGNADDSWGKTISDCGHSALNMFWGVNQGSFNKCLQKKVAISEECSTCYAKMAEYDFENCKLKCLFSWCSEGCMTCNKGSNLINCIGFVDPQPKTCSSSAALLAAQMPSNSIAMALVGFFSGSGLTFAMLRSRSSRASTGDGDGDVPLLTA